MKRLTHIENAKVVLIILVVFGHVVELALVRTPAGATVFLFVYLFHMPAFVALSGYLSRPDAYTGGGASRLSRLLLAYVLFQPLMVVAMWGSIPHSIPYVLLHPMFNLWWLLALVWWRLLLPLFALGTSFRAALISIAVAVALAVAFGRLPFDGSILSFSRTFVFLPFFVAGYRASQQRWRLPQGRGVIVTACACMIATITTLFLRYDINLSLWLFGEYAQFGVSQLRVALVGLMLTVWSSVLVLAFFTLLPRRSLPITVLGSSTLSIFLWHGVALQVLIATGLAPAAGGTWLAACVTTAVMVLIFGVGPVPKLTNRVIHGPSRSPGSDLRSALRG